MASDAEALGERLTSVFSAELSFQLDRQILNGTGAGVPLGLVNSPATIAVAKDSGQVAGTVSATNVMGMWSRLPGPCRERAVWLMNEDALSAIENNFDSGAVAGYTGLFQPAGSDGISSPRIKGRPVITVEQSPLLGTPGDIVLADLSQYAIVAKPPTFAVSAHVSFTSDQVIFRFTLRIDGKPKWTSPVTPFNGGSTRSPFVALAAR